MTPTLGGAQGSVTPGLKEALMLSSEGVPARSGEVGWRPVSPDCGSCADVAADEGDWYRFSPHPWPRRRDLERRCPWALLLEDILHSTFYSWRDPCDFFYIFFLFIYFYTWFGRAVMLPPAYNGRGRQHPLPGRWRHHARTCAWSRPRRSGRHLTLYPLTVTYVVYSSHQIQA